MAKRYAFLDLETTGLNPEYDEIIEIGAVIIENGSVIERFQTLVKPVKKLPSVITRITGITDEMLADAPDITEVSNSLLEFLGEFPVGGHNISFDIAFLKNNVNRHFANPLIDTWEIAQVVLPRAGSYRLEAIRTLLGIEDSVSHRALEDAVSAANVFYKCRSLFQQASQDLLFEIYNSVKDRNWYLGQVFASWIMEFSTSFPASKTGSTLVLADTVLEETGGLFANDPKQTRKTGPDIEKLADILAPGGPFAQKYPQYKFRPEQAEMLKTVVRGFLDAKHVIIEAGTGTGKSLAYLLPAITWSLNCGTKVMVATHTINLQEQLWNKDLPAIREAVGFNFNAALIKGRNNYLCLRRWQSKLRDRASVDLKELLFLLKVMFWLTSTRTGDKSELNILPPQTAYWGEINSDQDSCLGPECPWYHKNCFVTKARKQAEAADILIANHSLLLADIKFQNKLLPAYDYLIIDEAHHLEQTATEQLGWTISINSLKQMFFHLNRGFGGGLGPGPLSQFKIILKNYGDELSQAEHEKIDQTINDCFEVVRSIYDTIHEMEDILTAWCGRLVSGSDDESYLVIRVRRDDRQGEYWEAFTAVKDNYLLRTGNLIKMLNKLITSLDGISEEEIKSLAALRKDIEFQIQGLEEINSNLTAFTAGTEEHVFWLEIDKGAKSDARIRCAPVSVSRLLYENLFLTKISTLLTSATISVEGSFDHFMERVGLISFPEEKLLKHLLSSPFSYDTQSLLCVVRDMPDPGVVLEKEYIDNITPVIFQTAKIFGGKTLVLFTSHRMLRETYFKLLPLLEEAGIDLLGHRIDGGRTRLTEEFRKAKSAVLFGASSFWEGIDLPGEILKCVIIVRLPFAPPNTPIVEARFEELVKNNKDPFSSYSLPEAVIKMKQGFGRLIRAEDDDGVVVILDRRIVDRKYGRRFLNSLPAKTHFKGDTFTVLKKISNWAQGVRPEKNVINLLEAGQNVEKYLKNFKRREQ